MRKVVCSWWCDFVFQYGHCTYGMLRFHLSYGGYLDSSTLYHVFWKLIWQCQMDKRWGTVVVQNFHTLSEMFSSCHYTGVTLTSDREYWIQLNRKSTSKLQKLALRFLQYLFTKIIFLNSVKSVNIPESRRF